MQTNKDPGFMVYKWTMERGLAYIGSLCSSIGKQFWGTNHPRSAGKKKLWWNFQHTMSTSWQWWWKALLWCGHALVNNIHSLRTSDFQNFLQSPELRMLDVFFFCFFFLAICTSSFKNCLFTSLNHLLIGLLAILTFRLLSSVF